MEPLRILSSDNHLLEDGEGTEEVVIVATRPMHLRVLADDFVHIRISPNAVPVPATGEDFPVNEFEDTFVSLASGEQLSVVRGDGNSSPVFVSIAEVKRSIG